MKRKDFYSSNAWKTFRMFILLYHSLDGKICKCSTCGKFIKIGERNCHAGHYVKVYDGNSTNFNTAFHEKNVLPQCSQCNTYGGGKQLEMRQAIKEKFGEGMIQRLVILSKQVKKLDKIELNYMADHYKEKIEQLKKKKGWS